MELEQLDDPATLAHRLSVSDRTVRRLVESKAIPFYRVGDQLRFNPAEVLEALRSEPRSA